MRIPARIEFTISYLSHTVEALSLFSVQAIMLLLDVLVIKAKEMERYIYISIGVILTCNTGLKYHRWHRWLNITRIYIRSLPWFDSLLIVRSRISVTSYVWNERSFSQGGLLYVISVNFLREFDYDFVSTTSLESDLTTFESTLFENYMLAIYFIILYFII